MGPQVKSRFPQTLRTHAGFRRSKVNPFTAFYPYFYRSAVDISRFRDYSKLMNTRKWLQVGLTLLCSLGAVSVEAAPTLTVGSASGQAGASVTLPVTFNPGTSSVASLQFSLTLPPGLSTGAITPGAILTSAGKSVSSNLTGSTVTFIIFGFNQTPITSGSLLTTKLTISLGTAVGNLSLPVSGVFYSDPNGAVIAAGASTGGTVSVLPPVPTITSAGTATGQVGTAFSYQITASNSPTSFNATGLPAGLSVSTTTGLISGTPTAAATSNVALSASNAGGTGTRTLALTVYSACDLNQDGASNVVDVQLQVNQALGVTACTSDLNSDGACNVIDIQRDVNASLGLLCVVGP